MSEPKNGNPLSCVHANLSGRIALLEGMLQEKEQIREALQDSEKRYRRLFESAKDGILILDAETGKVVDVNPFLLNLLGFSYDEICGQYIWDLGVFKDVAASKEAFMKLQDNEYIRYEDLPLETRKGQSIDVEFVSNVYLVDHSRVIQCNIRDITARKRTEKALAQSEAKSRSILDNIDLGVALISPQMKVLELNHQMHQWNPDIDPSQHPCCYRAFNYPPHETPCDDCPTQKTFHDGLVHETMVQAPRAGLGVRTYRIVSSPILSPSGEVTAVIELVEDITEHLSMESQLRQAQKMDAVGRLAGGVAHDYNNMLSVILGYTELAMEKVDAAQPLYGDLEEIHKAATHSADITRQLLTFARKQTIIPVVIDLNQAVESVLKMLHRLIGEDVELEWIPVAGACLVKMDPVQVNQILTNLCINARQAIADVGKVTIKTETAFLDDAFCTDHPGAVVGDYVVLTTCDNGCGMDKKTLDQIFEPFFTSKGVGLGTGLGLATVYGIVKQNNGVIHVESQPGQGTAMRIYLPRIVDLANAGEEMSAEEIPLGHGETVLLVEDEPIILKLSKILLEKLGYRVLAVGKPGEALALGATRARDIDLLITDVVMPEMNGRELAERLQSLYPHLKILFMSGYPADFIAQRGVLDVGINFIQKPFSMKDLAVKVRGAIRER